MSFDVKAINGDIELGSNGDLVQYTDSDKLAQDIIKLLNTPLDSDPINPGYGSPLTVEQIGEVLSTDGLIEYTKHTIARALEQLITIQTYQSTFQQLSDAETLINFETPIVEPDASDPRQFNIAINAISRNLTPLTIALVVRF